MQETKEECAEISVHWLSISAFVGSATLSPICGHSNPKDHAFCRPTAIVSIPAKKEEDGAEWKELHPIPGIHDFRPMD